MKQLINVLKDVLETGTVKGDRTGTGTFSKFGGMMKFNIQHGAWVIPTTRKVAYMKIAEELEWMLKGLISVKWLDDKNNKIWNSWMGEQSGTIGPMYGEQWRNWNASGGLTKEVLGDLLEKAYNETIVDPAAFQFSDGLRELKQAFIKQVDEKTKPYEQGGRGGTDQLKYVTETLKNDPNSRRICVNVWHAGLLPDNSMTPSQNADAGNMALAPCHSMWQVESSPMSDLEILRYAHRERPRNYDHSEYLDEWESVMSYQNEYSVDILAAYSNVRLYAENLISRETETLQPMSLLTSILNRHTAVVPHGLRDKDFTITEAGHKLIEEYKAKDRPIRKLSLLCFARSQDVPLGTVYNVGMYSLLAHQLAAMTNMVPWEYTHFMGDYHIYANQVECVKEQIKRKPMEMPRVIVDPTLRNIEDFEAKNIQVFYKSHPAIKFPMAAV